MAIWNINCILLVLFLDLSSGTSRHQVKRGNQIQKVNLDLLSTVNFLYLQCTFKYGSCTVSVTSSVIHFPSIRVIQSIITFLFKGFILFQ